MTYNSIADFVADQNRAFDDLMNIDKVLRVAVLDSIVLIKDRVQQQGLKSDGSQIGKYTKGWATFRAKMGRQTSKVDLTFSGDMIHDYTIIPDGEDALGIGFNSDTQGQIARYNEENFDGVIFELSTDEEKFITDNIEAKVYAILTRSGR